MNDKKKPEIRFPEFTDDWEPRKLGEIYTERNEKGDESLQMLSVSIHSGVSDGELDEEKLGKTVRRSADKTTYKHVYYGDLIFNMMRAWQGAIGVAKSEGMISPAYISAIPNNELFPLFMDYALRRKEAIEQINSLSYGVTDFRKRLYWKAFVNVKCFLPHKTEQQKIWSFFNSLDKLIALHQSKCDKLKEYKRGCLQKMFPRDGAKAPEVRFSGFTDVWEQRKLREVADKVTTKNSGTQYVETLTNSAEFGIISQRDFFDHDVSNIDNIDGYYIVEDDAFVYNPRISTSAPVGPINRNKLGRTGVMSPLYTVFKTHDVVPEYLEWFFKSTGWHAFMKFNGDSGARSDRFSIKDAVFFDMPIPTPDIGEQRKIGAYLTSIDNLITLHQREYEKYKELKSGLLQKMFV